MSKYNFYVNLGGKGYRSFKSRRAALQCGEWYGQFDLVTVHKARNTPMPHDGLRVTGKSDRVIAEFEPEY